VAIGAVWRGPASGTLAGVDVVEISVWAGVVVVVATTVWAAVDHVRDGGHVATSPLLIVWAVLGASAFIGVLVLVALVVVGALIGITFPEWFPLDVGS
jgi:hypothetical protein